MYVVRSAVLACALVASVGGCGADDASPQRVSYTAEISSPPKAGTAKDERVSLSTETCPDSDGGTLVGVVPDGWQVDSSGADYCSWSRGTSNLTFEYGAIDGDPYKWLLLQSNTAQIDGSIPGYELIRQTSDAGGGPLWHYQYAVARVDGSVYVDSLHLFRGEWHVTYEADSGDYNTYVERELTQALDATD
ncbi:hypothetical protein MU582_03100 [Nocardioidaceae bacterium SCSIO 66511]|nr:hypothetical protein MU582_03100 [Nocardioidaceae bacterium SCSIO 66511]